jgi:hypothetical protein
MEYLGRDAVSVGPYLSERSKGAAQYEKERRQNIEFQN